MVWHERHAWSCLDDTSAQTDVLELILERGRAEPGKPAAKDTARDLSFAELEEAVAGLAGGLSRLGVHRGDRVALHLPNSVDFLVASMACMWLGAVFVPLSRSDPATRLSFIIEDCDPKLVLTSDSERAARDVQRDLYNGHLAIPMTGVPAGHEPPPRARDSGRPAYCIYTSGTTGRPKGVLIGHDAFACAVISAARLLELGPETRALCVSPFHFDGSYGTLFPTPVAGGSLVIPHHESLLLPRMFFKTIIEERITHTSFSPSYLRLLLSSHLMSDLSRSSMRTLGLGGEACHAADLEQLWSFAPDLRVFNRYGPTEVTIAVTTFEVTPEVLKRGPLVPVGPPHPGVTFRILDAHGDAVEQTEKVGELYIGGTQLMVGYWGDPDLTATVLRTDFVPGELLYKTGDLVYQDDWGDCVYVDRADRVVKRSAVRISVAEIDHALRRFPGVSAAVCLPFDQSGRLAIAAFIVSDAPMSELEFRKHALDHLPPTMIPDVFRLIDALPMTSVSKVDERALLASAGLADDSQASFF
jgi:amino acid adenylation domain-containing protein